MINLIKLEIYKLKRLNLFKMIILFVVAISALSAISALNIKTEDGLILAGRTQYVNNFHDIAMLLVNAILAGAYIGIDFNNRTIQAQIARGQTRKNIFISKITGYILATSIITLVYPVVGATIVTIKNGWGEIITIKEILYILFVAVEGIILNIGTSSFFVLFVFTFRDVTKSICFCLAFPVLFSFVKPLFSNIPVLNIFVDLLTLSQMRNIGIGSLKNIIIILVSSIFSFILSYIIANTVFKKAEIK